MAQFNLVKGQLISYHEQLEQMSQGVIAFLLRSRINDFYNEYGIRIRTILKERFELMCQYHETTIKQDEQGNDYPELVWEKNDKGQNVRYKIQEGKTYEDFQTAYQEWAKSPVSSGITLVKA